MKNFVKVTVTMLILSIVLQMFMVTAEPYDLKAKEMRGVWVASVVNIDYPTKPTTDILQLKNEAVSILDNAQNMGMNAVFLQVRPAADAFYKSKYFPWSKYLTGTQGLIPAENFDPLEFWIAEAHKRGIELHAWINPYRVTKKTAKEPAHDFAALDPNNPARLHPEWVVKHTDGDLYFDPGIPEVRKLVIDGVLEIVENYAVDGIHFDDYFYPSTSFADKATYELYGKGYANINDWRRANVDTLIMDLDKAIKATPKKVSFGISPFGIWANKATNALGSDTKGKQSFYDQYADTRKWVKEGWIDYIAPQIYWNIGYTIADYSKLLTWWQEVVKNTDVSLYIGQAAYKACNPAPASPWYGVAELEKQLKLNAKTPEVKGSIYFSYKSLLNSPALAAVVKGFYQQKDGITASIPLVVSRPTGNLQTSLTQFYIQGSSDPSKPLYINGKLVESRSPSGYFGILLPLQVGQNLFTLAQEGSYTTRAFFRPAAVAAAPAKMSAADIPAGSMYPQTKEYRSPGEKITFTCQAPIGSKVTVKIGSEIYPMQPANSKPAGAGLYPDKFTYVYTLPNYEGEAKVVELGVPEYTMYYNGTVKTKKAAAGIAIIMKNAPFYAEMAKDVVNTYQTATTANGAAFELYKGMLEYITAISGSYTRLSSGLWVVNSDIKVVTTPIQQASVVTGAAYFSDEKWESLQLDMTVPAAAYASFDGKNVKLEISKTASSLVPALSENALFSSITLANTEGKLQYLLSLKENQRIEGYYIEKTQTGIQLKIKKPVTAKEGNAPLQGVTVMLDPGHGGSDPGAIGPLGLSYAEKTINLNAALKLQIELEKLGATVLMTRTTDKALTLEERLTASRNAKPDLFISLHSNSMGDNVDISKVEGFSAFYKEKLAQPAAEAVFNKIITGLGRGNKGLHAKNLYVTRGTWTPSILLESGFVPNPYEFEWLKSEVEQTKYAQSIAEAVAGYFGAKQNPLTVQK